MPSRVWETFPDEWHAHTGDLFTLTDDPETYPGEPDVCTAHLFALNHEPLTLTSDRDAFCASFWHFSSPKKQEDFPHFRKRVIGISLRVTI